MSAAILHFPAQLRAVPQPDLRAEIVDSARAILRSPARHDDAILTEACVALQTYGDGNDWLIAEAMLMAMSNRDRRQAHDAASAEARSETHRGTIRRALAETAIFAAFAAAILIVGLAL
jgi:hypothetical protein